MNPLCKKNRDLIADAFADILTKEQTQKVDMHLSMCSACQSYADDLKEEHQQLIQLVAGLDQDMTERRQRLLKKPDFDRPIKTAPLSKWRLIMKNNIIRSVAAAIILISVAVGLYFFPTSQAYGITEAVGLLGHAKTMHVQIKRFSQDQTRPAMPAKYWYNLEEGKMYYYYEHRSSEEEIEGRPFVYNGLATIWDGHFVMHVNHREKTVHYERLLTSQQDLHCRMIRNMALEMALQDIHYLHEYTKVGKGEISGQSYDIWRRDFLEPNSKYHFRYETWVSPSNGEIGRTRTYVIFNRASDEWFLQTETDKIAIDTELPSNIFSTEPPKGYTQVNSKTTAEVTGIGFKTFKYQGEYELRVPVSLTLEDGSVLACWYGTSEPAQVNPGEVFGSLEFGGDLPKTPIALYRLMSRPDRNHREPIVYYTGRHLANTHKAGRYYEWAIYVPQHETKHRETLNHTIAVLKINVQDPNLPDKMPTWGLSSSMVIGDAFNKTVREAVLELSDVQIFPEELTYDNLLDLASRIRRTPSLYIVDKDLKNAEDHIMKLKPVEIVTPEKAQRKLEQARQEAKRVVEDFFVAIREKRDRDANELLIHKESLDSMNRMRQLLGQTKIQVKDIYATNSTALVLTSEFSVREELRGRFAISVAKENDIWLIQDFDPTTTAKMQKEIDKYLELFPKAQFFRKGD